MILSMAQVGAAHGKLWGHLPLVSLLLDLGADPRQRDSMVTKFAPLDEAALGGDNVHPLLEAGAAYTVFHKNLHGDTPVHTASEGQRG